MGLDEGPWKKISISSQGYCNTEGVYSSTHARTHTRHTHIPRTNIHTHKHKQTATLRGHKSEEHYVTPSDRFTANDSPSPVAVNYLGLLGLHLS